MLREFEARISCERHVGGDDQVYWVDGNRILVINDAWMFNLKSEDDELPNDERGATQHMLIDPGASLYVGLADLLHRRCGTSSRSASNDGDG